MRKILLTCLLSLSLVCSAFAITSAIVKPMEPCNPATECNAKDAKGCKVSSCEFSSIGTEKYVTCNYASCSSEMEISVSEGVN